LVEELVELAEEQDVLTQLDLDAIFFQSK